MKRQKPTTTNENISYMNTYYVITAEIEGCKEELFGSFDKSDCKYEIESEKDYWKGEGYKKIKIESKQVEAEASEEVYENIVTSKELFNQQAPSFNFELDEFELLEHALEVGFVTKVGENKYLINSDY